MINLVNSFTNGVKFENMSFHPEGKNEFNKTIIEYNALSEETINELKELSKKAKELNEKLFRCIQIQDSELEEIVLPQEYLDYNLTKQDLTDNIDPIIIANLNLQCKNNVNKNQLTKLVLLGFNIRLANRIINLSVIEGKIADEFEIDYDLKLHIKELRNGKYSPYRDENLRNLKLRKIDDIERLSYEETQKRIDPFTQASVNMVLKSPLQQEKAFKWILRGLQISEAIRKAQLDAEDRSNGYIFMG